MPGVGVGAGGDVPTGSGGGGASIGEVRGPVIPLVSTTSPALAIRVLSSRRRFKMKSAAATINAAARSPNTMGDTRLLRRTTTTSAPEFVVVEPTGIKTDGALVLAATAGAAAGGRAAASTLGAAAT